MLNTRSRFSLKRDRGLSFFAQLVRLDNPIAGFQTLQMDQKSQKIIEELVLEYQKPLISLYRWIDSIYSKSWMKKGNEIEITF